VPGVAALAATIRATSWHIAFSRNAKVINARIILPPNDLRNDSDHRRRGRGAISKPEPDGTLTKALALAWRWQRMLDDGVYASVSEIGDAENISKSYISRSLRLALLAPDIVDVILAGRTDQGVMLEQLERPLPASWEEQRDHLGW
jgi:hypothetical protein